MFCVPKLRRTFLSRLGIALTGCALFAAGGLAHAQSKVVNVYNWSDYIAEDTIANFEKETGIKVVYDVYDSNDILETKLLAGKTGYDVVVPTNNYLARLIQAGVLGKLDKAKLPNLQYMDKELMARMANYDPGNEHAVIYLWGTTGIGYNTRSLMRAMPDAPVYSLRMIFDPAIVSRFRSCGVIVLDSPTDVFPAALAYLGLDPDSKNPADLEKATAALQAIRPFVRRWHSSDYINALASGDACLAFGFSGDVKQAARRAAESRQKHCQHHAPQQQRGGGDLAHRAQQRPEQEARRDRGPGEFARRVHREQPEHGERQAVEKAHQRCAERAETCGEVALCRVAKGLREGRADGQRDPQPGWRGGAHPRPTKGILVAMMVMNWMFTSRGSPAMCTTASATRFTSIIASTFTVPSACLTPVDMRLASSVSALPMSIWLQAMSYLRPSSEIDLVSPVTACLVAV